MLARVLSQHGRHAWVIDEKGVHRHCVMKGRDLSPVANDEIVLDIRSDPAVIESICPRTNVVLRSEAHKSKTLAANIDQVLIMVSGHPPFSEELLARMICAATAEDISGALFLNKTDLQAATSDASAKLESFAQALDELGWPIFKGSAEKGSVAELEGFLTGKKTLIMGQSGMGKTSLMNALIPGLELQTQEISEALQTGKHTTTASKMLQCERLNAWLIDTPGFQLFGLHHLSESQIALGFPEWQSIMAKDGRCKYANCHHQGEPECSVARAAGNSPALARRLELWGAIIGR